MERSRSCRGNPPHRCALIRPPMPHASTRFHAVGQGCFYSGEIFCAPNHDPLRLVYDCGSETAGDALEREVELFHQIIHDAKLDVLVLSHLDADHVNGLSLLLDNGLTARYVFLPYLTPAQRAIAAAGAADKVNQNYFELLADPVAFLEGRGVENIVFVSGGGDEEEGNSEYDVPSFPPSNIDGDSPNLGDLNDDREGKSHFHRGEESKQSLSGVKLAQSRFLLEGPRQEGVEDSRPAQKAILYFKTDRRPFRLTRCWQGKFFHRDAMRLPISAILGAQDFTIRPGDSTTVQRYKRFLADVHGCFGTLDPVRLVMAIRDKDDRKKLRECYHHIRGNHNDVSLVLWHGPLSQKAYVSIESCVHSRGWDWGEGLTLGNGGTLLTGDLTCTSCVTKKLVQHFGSRMSEIKILHVPHHGSVHSWNNCLLHGANSEIIAVICAGRKNKYSHPHPQVINSLKHSNIPWIFCDERNTVAINIETI
jgi:beta-lactamase superfamily II metal-dependent hydrolase